MSNGWSGADPTQAIDPGSYELGVEFMANQDITITAVRVWAGATPGAVTNRVGRVWSTAGAQLGSAAMATNLPAGWTTYTLSTPVIRLAGSRWVVSYDNGGNYGQLINGLGNDVVSADTAVTALGFAHSTNGNGVFTTSVGQFPTTASGNHTFYGIDIVYSLGAGGNMPPVITGMSATATNATVTAVINATGQLTNATYAFDWGDGTSTSGSSNTAVHTYTASGDYAVLGSVTDANGLAAYAARSVEVDLPDPAVQALDVTALIDQLASHAATLGVLDGPVNGHEPVSPPGSGVTGAVWFNTIRPARGRSGLNATTVVVVCTMRLYKALLSQPQDAIDPALVSAMNLLLAAYSGAFTLGGTVADVDLLGEFGTPLWAQSAYQTIEATQYRVISITVPVVVNDVWQQVA